MANEGLLPATTEQRAREKRKLLDMIKPLHRGATASEDDKQAMERQIKVLEQLNPTKNPLESGLVNGKWRLLYTTSAGILRTFLPFFLRPGGPIYQIVDLVNMRLRNVESWPFYNQVTGDLAVVDDVVKVQLDMFWIFGFIPIKAPHTSKAKFTVTYLDDELRISRGDKGNVFILTMEDRSAKA